MWRKPICQVVRQGGSGADILAGPLGVAFIGVEVVDAEGQESDSCSIVLADPRRRQPLPRKGDLYKVALGWEDEGALLAGLYAVQGCSHSGMAGMGERLSIQLRAADFTDKLKGKARRAYEGPTVGAVFEALAGEAGLGAAIDPELAAAPLPGGYRLRWDQSAIDFATELVEEHGGVVKPAGGKLVVMRRGAGSTGSGAALEEIRIKRRGRYGWDIDLTEPRPVHGKVAASWLDPATGRRRLVSVATGQDGPYQVLQHPYADEAAARAAAEAEAYALGTRSGGGTFESPGLPRARAGAPVIAEGFGEGIDGRWIAEEVRHTVDKARGFVTTVTVGAGKEVKG